MAAMWTGFDFGLCAFGTQPVWSAQRWPLQHLRPPPRRRLSNALTYKGKTRDHAKNNRTNKAIQGCWNQLMWADYLKYRDKAKFFLYFKHFQNTHNALILNSLKVYLALFDWLMGKGKDGQRLPLASFNPTLRINPKPDCHSFFMAKIEEAQRWSRGQHFIRCCASF